MDRRFVMAVLTVLTVPGLAFARPELRTATDTDDDATITLNVLSEYITGDSRSFCSVRLVVAAVDVVFTEGDHVYLWVYEDDIVGDETIFEVDFAVDPAEVAAGALDRSFDCTGAFPPSDTGDYIEVYAEARVETAACGTWCIWDRPTTANIDLLGVADDAAEEDDAVDIGVTVTPGLIEDRIVRDSDWMLLELAAPAAVEVQARYLPATGEMDVFFSDTTGTNHGTATDTDGGTVVVTPVVAAGSYRINLWPRTPPDFSFYDALITLTPADCATGETERRPCGNCGEETRACVDGAWADWGECAGEGECSPGDEETTDCRLCGTRLATCTDACVWEAADCVGEGICDSGDRETVPCPGGTAERLCGPDCQWQEPGDCVPDPVEDGGPSHDGGPSDGGPDGGGTPDGGTPDGGTPDGDGGSSGCSCRATDGGTASSTLLTALIGIGALALRRR